VVLGGPELFVIVRRRSKHPGYAAAQEEWPQAQCEAWCPVVSISAHFSLQNFFPSRSIVALPQGHPRCWQFMSFSFLVERMEQFRPTRQRTGYSGLWTLSSQPPVNPAFRSPSTSGSQRRMRVQIKPLAKFSIMRTTGPWSRP